MNVLIYEPYANGHRLHYVALLVPALRSVGCNVLLGTTASTVQSPQYKIHLGELESDFTIVETAEVDDSLRGKHGAPPKQIEAQRFADTLSDSRPDHLLVPTASQFTSAFAKRFIFRKSFAKHPLPAEGLHMSPGYGYPELGFRRRSANAALKLIERNLPWSTYAHLDPFQLSAIKTKRDLSKKFQLMPDPAPEPPSISKAKAREHFGIPTNGRYIGCSGAISMSKGIFEMTEAFRNAAPQIDADDRLLFVGRFTKEVEKYIEQDCQELVNSGRLLCINRHLTEYEMDIIPTAFDIICTAQHWRPGSSGVLIRGAAASVPVLSRDQFWAGRIVPKFNLGWTCTTLDTKKFAASMVTSLQELETYRPDESSKRFVKFHSVENFQATWLQNIRQRLGISADPNRLQWEWVLNG